MKIFSMESGKSINQIFDNLKVVFGGLDADVKVSKKKSGGVKVVASHKDVTGKKSKIKVSLQEKEVLLTVFPSVVLVIVV